LWVPPFILAGWFTVLFRPGHAHQAVANAVLTSQLSRSKSNEKDNLVPTVFLFSFGKLIQKSKYHAALILPPFLLLFPNPECTKPEIGWCAKTGASYHGCPPLSHCIGCRPRPTNHRWLYGDHNHYLTTDKHVIV